MLSHPLQSSIVKILLLSVLYFALGRASLLLAIPPANAMAIFLPAGLAFGAVLIAGYRMLAVVWLGSFYFMLSVAWENSAGLASISANGVIMAMLIASGATLQAAFCAWLVRRWVGYPTALDSNRAIITLFIIVGPVGSLINASLGVFTLQSFGLIPSHELLSSWFIWWASDALGGVIVTPMCLILRGQPRQVWRSRRLQVLLPVLLALSVIISGFLYVREWEQKNFRSEFHDTAQRIANALQTRLDYHIEIQKSVVSLFAASDAVSRKQFSRFIAQPVNAYAAVQAIEWAPRIAHSARAQFEADVRAEGFSNYAIREKQGEQLVAASQRKEYFPITYAAPELGNEMVLGIDIGFDKARQQGIEEARDLGLPVASAPVALAQAGDAPASLLISAVYANNLPTRSKMQRQKAMTGLVITVLQPGDALEELLTATDKRNILVRLQDAQASQPGPLQTKPYFSNLGNSHSSGQRSSQAPRPGQPLWQTTLNFAGRELVFSADPSAAYYAEHRAWAAWSMMVAGSLFTALISMYLLLVSGRTFSIETLVKARTRQLHQSEHRLHLILDNAAEGILTFDCQGQVLIDNRAARLLLAETSLHGRSFASLFQQHGQAMALPQGDPQADPQADSQADASSDADHAASLQAAGIFREVQGLRPDGSLIDLGMSLAQARRENQTLSIVIIHDLTEQKRVERLKGEFVSTVSHELRTPLTSIRGALGLMAGGALGPVPTPMQKLMGVAKDNAERLATLINDILDFEKLEYGGMLFQQEPHSLFKLVQSAIDSNQGYADKFSIRLALLTSADPQCQVLTDANRLLQVLSNLISNAIKFSHPQGQVELKLETGTSHARVWVIDHGIGISSTFQKQIFGKFSQEDGSGQRKYAGTGLGLSLSKAMIEKLGGKIGFDSVEGQGSRFYIELPLVSITASSVAQGEPDEASQP